MGKNKEVTFGSRWSRIWKEPGYVCFASLPQSLCKDKHKHKQKHTYKDFGRIQYVLVFASVFKKKHTNENIARDCKKCPMSLSVCLFNLLVFVAMFISLISFVGIRKGYSFILFNDFRRDPPTTTTPPKPPGEAFYFKVCNIVVLFCIWRKRLGEGKEEGISYALPLHCCHIIWRIQRLNWTTKMSTIQLLWTASLGVAAWSDSYVKVFSLYYTRTCLVSTIIENIEYWMKYTFCHINSRPGRSLRRKAWFHQPSSSCLVWPFCLWLKLAKSWINKITCFKTPFRWETKHERKQLS